MLKAYAVIELFESILNAFSYAAVQKFTHSKLSPKIAT